MTQPQPDLSTVIVNWNTLDMLRDVLRSYVDAPTRYTHQILVIDNASSDGSADMVAAEFPQVELIRNTKNVGFAAANNQGFEMATGRHVLLLNSDTIVLGDVLDASVAYLDAKPEVGAMGCRVLNEDRTMQRTCYQWPSLLNMILLGSGLWRIERPAAVANITGRYQMMTWQRDTERSVDTISGCYLMLRREVLDQVGPLDDDFFFFGEETDWCRRMRDASWPLMFAPVGEIVHYGGGSAKKLNHKRDLMLTDALVRLHRKHGGAIAGAAMWTVLFGFNLSRAVFWGLRSVVQRRASVKERFTHFSGVVRGQLGLLRD